MEQANGNNPILKRIEKLEQRGIELNTEICSLGSEIGYLEDEIEDARSEARVELAELRAYLEDEIQNLRDDLERT